MTTLVRAGFDQAANLRAAVEVTQPDRPDQATPETEVRRCARCRRPLDEDCGRWIVGSTDGALALLCSHRCDEPEPVRPRGAQ